MRRTAQHCFVLDGKALLPIDHHDQLFVPFNFVDSRENRDCSGNQQQSQSDLFDHHSIDRQRKAINTNKHCQVDQGDLSSCSSQLRTKLSEDKHDNEKISSRKIAIAKRRHRFNAQINTKKDMIETYLITRIMSPINHHTMNSTQINNHSYGASSPITIIIQPSMSSESYYHQRRDTSLVRKLSSDERKTSSSSLKTTPKRISISRSDHILPRISPKQRLLTFQEIKRPMLARPDREMTSPTILHSRTLLNIYQNKKQRLRETSTFYSKK